MYQKTSIGLLFAGLLVLAAACGGDTQSSESSAQGKLRVVTSLSVFADLVRNVGGERVAVANLVPPGADAHTFQATPKDSVASAKADVVFLNGLGLDSFIEDVVKNVVRPGVPVVVLTEGLAPAYVDARGEKWEQADNPHMWLDVRLAIKYVERIRDALTRRDPANAGVFQENAQKYIRELEQLDGEMERAMASIPPHRRKLITFHDAFPYFARRYGLELVGFVVGSSSGEPSAKEVAALVERIRREGVPVVFVEPQFNARVLELAAREAGVKVRVLYNDALDQKVGSYIALMRFNMTQVLEGLR